MTKSSESPPPFIAVRELIEIDSAGREFPIKLAIGQLLDCHGGNAVSVDDASRLASKTNLFDFMVYSS